jgi:hypothetical protein
VEEALVLNPEYAEAWQTKGVVLAEQGKKKESVQWLCRAWRVPDEITDNAATAERYLRVQGRTGDQCSNIPEPLPLCQNAI